MNKGRLTAIAVSLPLILGVAMACRAGMTASYVRDNPRQALAVIPFMFESGNIAKSLAAGNGFADPFRVPTGPTAWMTPVYPALLAGLMRAVGTYTFASFLGAASLNIVFSVLACVPIYFAGKRIGGVGLGAAAAWLWAIFPNAILQTFETLWDASLDAFLGALLLWTTLAVAESRRWAWFCGYGLLWGLALMTNPAFGALLPFLLGWVVSQQRSALRSASARRTFAGISRWMRRPALALGIAVLCCIPWTARNYARFHHLVPLRSVFGLQLWLGNSDATTPRWLGLHHPIFDEQERAHYIAIGEIAYMREKLELALGWMRAHPARVMQLSARRFLAVWSGGQSYPVRYFLRSRSIWDRFVLLFNVFAAISALAATVVLFRARSRFAIPLAAFPLIFPLPYYITLVEPRYRLPIDPVILLLAAIAVRGTFPSRGTTILTGGRARRAKGRTAPTFQRLLIRAGGSSRRRTIGKT